MQNTYYLTSWHVTKLHSGRLLITLTCLPGVLSALGTVKSFEFGQVGYPQKSSVNFFFRIVFRFTEKLQRRFRRFPYTLHLVSPIVNIYIDFITLSLASLSSLSLSLAYPGLSLSRYAFFSFKYLCLTKYKGALCQYAGCFWNLSA